MAKAENKKLREKEDRRRKKAEASQTKTARAEIEQSLGRLTLQKAQLENHLKQVNSKSNELLNLLNAADASKEK